MSLIQTATMPPTLTEKIDKPSSDVTYFGQAKLGTADDDAGWLISRVLKDGSLISTQYANGSRRFNQKWSDRATLTYVN
jgi:hypothetical protein